MRASPRQAEATLDRPLHPELASQLGISMQIGAAHLERQLDAAAGVELQQRGGADIETARQRRRDRVPSVRLRLRSEEHTSELQSLMRISYAVFCLKKKIRKQQTTNSHA